MTEERKRVNLALGGRRIKAPAPGLVKVTPAGYVAPSKGAVDIYSFPTGTLPESLRAPFRNKVKNEIKRKPKYRTQWGGPYVTAQNLSQYRVRDRIQPRGQYGITM
jgi:hypothetical protein